ncbi:hypothetical protein VTN96DRAFT_1822 [Rasamsonia emersonii]|uniref:Uncharacterized protein n=1 Tax=Rasamsonia emersonii (strain ATCC 16479 / CBS 393.64 / IMI 116815) TaxID=1408163 RepID=A0A0F4YLV3_RASE3|nr:hypothetical protein T310_7204 [Rasamsonia emersonii CBS 393.64]KKA18836.1 hypothetical protein T310_7204 [Rasamsonia emersonii CBS 393.64]
MATEMHSFYTPSAPSHISSHSPQIVDELISKYSSTMSTTSSSPSPPTSQRRSLLKRVIDRIRLEYYRYEVTFGVYVMTPGEKFVANTFVIVFLSLLIWASLLYFPQLLYQKLRRLIWLLTGHSEDVGVVFDMFDKGFRTQSAALSTSTSLAS